MLDEHGDEIDLDLVDAIGLLPDGRYDIWLQNDRRVVSDHPNAFEIWREHIRSARKGELSSRPQVF